jgi:deoxyadenosine/deoxycytidine kinase
LAEDEYRLYRNLLISFTDAKTGFVYLFVSKFRNFCKTLKGRSYEQKIPAEYLDKINSGYLDYIKSQTDLNVLIIDVSDRDFVKNQEDYLLF